MPEGFKSRRDSEASGIPEVPEAPEMPEIPEVPEMPAPPGDFRGSRDAGNLQRSAGRLRKKMRREAGKRT